VQAPGKLGAFLYPAGAVAASTRANVLFVASSDASTPSGIVAGGRKLR